MGETNEQVVQDEEAPEQLDASAAQEDETPDVEGHMFAAGPRGPHSAEGPHGAHGPR